MEFVGEWLAIHDRMPGKPPTLRVSGTGRFPTGGWTAKLVDHDGPQGINPRILIIDLQVSAPDGDAPDVITDIDVALERTTSATYDQVHILVRGDAEGSRLIDVQDVS